MSLRTVRLVSMCAVFSTRVVFAQSSDEPRTSDDAPRAAEPKTDLPTEEEIARELGTVLGTAPPGATTTSSPVVRLVDISADLLAAAGTSTAGDDSIAELQDGAHDPNRRGFTIENLELSLVGAIDPYFAGEMHLVFQLDREGESTFELEEAFLTTQSLPLGLQAKAGMFFTELGRLNPQHPHAWDFADQPVINSRLFGGDGLRSPGARISWLTPLPWWSEFLFAIQNANGETAFSFLSAEDEGEFAGFAFEERPVRSFSDVLYAGRWFNSWSMSRSLALNFGISGATGPNPTGADARTWIVGSDLYVRWQPTDAYHGWPFVAFQTEALARRYELGTGGEEREDWGGYGQLLWGATHRWVLGARYDFAEGRGPGDGPAFDERQRASLNASFYPTEFSKFRLQYNFDAATFLEDDQAHTVWLQFEYLLGSHGAHTF
jgi:hypothetical protein